MIFRKYVLLSVVTVMILGPLACGGTASVEEEAAVEDQETAPPEKAVVTEEEVATGEEVSTPLTERDYRQDMRDLVQKVSAYAKAIDPNLIVVPQNGHELLIENREEYGIPAVAYLDAIDGVGREGFLSDVSGPTRRDFNHTGHPVKWHSLRRFPAARCSEGRG
ncbi:MAG: hypothetical protein ISS55_09220 [Dehalococcoidales bacterium]|nr:hypothetical protein [Dehalococcoidales bacterium]